MNLHSTLSTGYLMYWGLSTDGHVLGPTLGATECSSPPPYRWKVLELNPALSLILVRIVPIAQM